MVGGAGALAGVAVDDGPGHALGDGARPEHEVDAHAAVLVEVAGAVVPVAVEPIGVGVHAPEQVFHAPLLELRDGFAFGRRHVRRADELRRVPHVAVFGRDVEVAEHDERVVGRVLAAIQSCSVCNHTSLRS